MIIEFVIVQFVLFEVVITAVTNFFILGLKKGVEPVFPSVIFEIEIDIVFGSSCSTSSSL